MFCPQEKTKIFSSIFRKGKTLSKYFLSSILQDKGKKIGGDCDDVLIPIPFL